MRTEIIAEIGHNHGGDMELAKDMIAAAKVNGADYAKFQTWSVKNLTAGSWDSDGRREIYEKAELSRNQHEELLEYCNTMEIKFLTSCFREQDLYYIRSLMKEVKLPSHESRNWKLLRKAHEMFDRVFLSLGAIKADELPAYIGNSIPMHCVSAYPCPPEKANLGRIAMLEKEYGKSGYSGHCKGPWDAMIAISMGAQVVEKHFTTNRSLPGRDNAYAIMPGELALIAQFRDMFPAMTADHGMNYQDIEADIRNNYGGRWNRSADPVQK
jgi:sialic acid synthase SpsE